MASSQGPALLRRQASELGLSFDIPSVQTRAVTVLPPVQDLTARRQPLRELTLSLVAMRTRYARVPRSPLIAPERSGYARTAQCRAMVPAAADSAQVDRPSVTLQAPAVLVTCFAGIYSTSQGQASHGSIVIGLLMPDVARATGESCFQRPPVMAASA